MSEKDKMLRQMLYDANGDAVLNNDRIKCKDLCYEFNMIKPSQTIKKEEVIKKILGKVKGKFVIMAPFWCDYGYNIEIGSNFFLNYNCTILDAGKVIFGDNVFIGPDCGFYTANHPFDVKKRNEGLEYAHPIKIGNNVWIGGGVKVMPGVTIGDNTIIGGGSVVTKNIPKDCLAFGNPCKVIRKITADDLDQEYNK